jgi:DNA-binding response OmpR family regulator
MQQKHTLKAGENYLPKPFGMAELLSIVNKAVLQPARF